MHIFYSNVSSSVNFEYDLYFMLSLFKFQHLKSKHKISIVSEVNENRLIRTENIKRQVCHNHTNNCRVFSESMANV